MITGWIRTRDCLKNLAQTGIGYSEDCLAGHQEHAWIRYLQSMHPKVYVENYALLTALLSKCIFPGMRTTGSQTYHF